MRIAYIAPYQGPGLHKSRPTLLNLGLAANVKIELIGELLQRSVHDVEILSQGEIVERQLRFYPAFCEPDPFRASIPAYYASSLPVKFVNALWPSFGTLRLFRRRHRIRPFDLVIIYNLKLPQVICASYAIKVLGLPVVLEFEDDSFVGIDGEMDKSFRGKCHLFLATKILHSLSGALGVSPFLLSRLPTSIPTILLRGVVTEEIMNSVEEAGDPRKNWIVFSGTHSRTKGLEPLITAWDMLDLPGWELHIAGDGEMTAELRKRAESSHGIVFHGLLNRQANARLLSSAKIGINPHDVSQTPGNIFAFKIIEYLAAGTHVVTTPMGALESELEAGITYMPDNSPETIARTLIQVIQGRLYEQTAMRAAQREFGPSAVSRLLDRLLRDVTTVRHSSALHGVLSLPNGKHKED